MTLFRTFRLVLCVLIPPLGAVLSGCSGSAEKETAATANASPKEKIILDVGMEKEEAVSVPKLTDITESSGVKFSYKNGEKAGYASILESLGGGVGVFDYDLDGKQDLFFTGGGTFGPGETMGGLPSAMYRATSSLKYADVSVIAGVSNSLHYSHGCSVGDYDCDGFPDLVVTGYGGVAFFQNQGDGTFIERQDDAGLKDTLWSSSAGWGDINNDGFPDLYVVHYTDWSFKNHPYCAGPTSKDRDVCSPKKFASLPDTLYLNNADGTFRDGSQEVGLRKDGKGLGVLLCDVDVDGDVDVYVTNDTVDNFLYINRGDGTFEEVGLLSGVAVNDQGSPDGSMGTDVCDFNRDGLPDLIVANFEHESFALYRNEGKGQFLHVSVSTGITALGSLFVGFGLGMVDLDRDGWEDMISSNGHVIRFPRAAPLRQLPLFLKNDKGWFRRGQFPKDSYFGSSHMGRGLAIVDLDNDGDMDLVFSHTNEPASLILNELKDESSWLKVKMIGRTSSRDAVGGSATLITSEGKWLRLVKGGGSYLSQTDPWPYWGIPADVKAEKLAVTWPSGIKQEIPISQLNQTLTLIEPDASPAE